MRRALLNGGGDWQSAQDLSNSNTPHLDSLTFGRARGEVTAALEFVQGFGSAESPALHGFYSLRLEFSYP